MCIGGRGSRFRFSFQAEDGIRDLVRSRGLGDVYKRQAQALLERQRAVHAGGHHVQARLAVAAIARGALDAVSYTHLTLPTSDLV